MKYTKVVVNVGCLASPAVGRFLTRGHILNVDSEEYMKLVDSGIEVSSDPNSGAMLLAIIDSAPPKPESPKETAEPAQDSVGKNSEGDKGKKPEPKSKGKPEKKG